jgi:hypothetical protein
MAIQIKTLDELKIMRRAGLLVGQTLNLLRDSIKVGMRTDALDAIAAANIKRGEEHQTSLAIMGIQQQFVYLSMMKSFTGFQVIVLLKMAMLYQLIVEQLSMAGTEMLLSHTV